MGYGDEIIGTGLARGAHKRGKRIAFGDGVKISWSQWCKEMFAGNPNIAPPGSEGAPDLEWINHCKGHRLYNKQSGTKWLWNYDFAVKPGEFFFTETEKQNAAALRYGSFVVIEPNLPWHKPVAVNKDWGLMNYAEVAHALGLLGHTVVQFKHRHTRRELPGARLIALESFRQAVAVLARAQLYIGPEGGMHHAAAAVGVKAVVLFGGFIPPAVMGYGSHINLVGNSSEACGNTTRCEHCRSALDSIAPDDVIEWAKWGLQNGHGHHLAVGK
jgi:ADP-heptose:LPS heptosyltransferase